ncbi:hypothetical protein PALU110988_14660 [Paenibacillus lupini]|nr:hypothetical protein [Paenibacillus lupini]
MSLLFPGRRSSKVNRTCGNPNDTRHLNRDKYLPDIKATQVVEWSVTKLNNSDSER